MKRTKNHLALASFLPLLLAGCDGDGGGNRNPAPPAVGAQIERMGRAVTNTALIGPFLPQDQRGPMQDVYNAAPDPSTWANQFAEEIQNNLAIYDGLDTVCGNQLAADQAAERYSFLAGVLADDRLYVNTDSGTCQTYLGVEANALGSANSDCGGRTPLYDTVDISYSVLAAGAFSGVTDGIPEDADGDASTSDLPFYDVVLNLP